MDSRLPRYDLQLFPQAVPVIWQRIGFEAAQKRGGLSEGSDRVLLDKELRGDHPAACVVRLADREAPLVFGDHGIDEIGRLADTAEAQSRDPQDGKVTADRRMLGPRRYFRRPAAAASFSPISAILWSRRRFSFSQYGLVISLNA